MKRSFQKALEAREVELAQVGAARAAVSAQLDEMVSSLLTRHEAQLHDADARQEQLSVDCTKLRPWPRRSDGCTPCSRKPRYS